MVIPCSHLRDHWGIHPRLAAASYQDFFCFCVGEFGDTHAGMCVIRKGNHNLTVKVLSPASGLVLPTKTSITNLREHFLMQCNAEVKIKTRTHMILETKICRGDVYNDNVSNQFASNLILEELKLKVLQENLTDNQATT